VKRKEISQNTWAGLKAGSLHVEENKGERESDSETKAHRQTPSMLVFSAHLKADQTQQPETVHALAQLLFLASQMQYQDPET